MLKPFPLHIKITLLLKWSIPPHDFDLTTGAYYPSVPPQNVQQPMTNMQAYQGPVQAQGPSYPMIQPAMQYQYPYNQPQGYDHSTTMPQQQSHSYGKHKVNLLCPFQPHYVTTNWLSHLQWSWLLSSSWSRIMNKLMYLILFWTFSMVKLWHNFDLKWDIVA